MLKKDKPMLSVADIIQAQGKVWDHHFSGKLSLFNFFSLSDAEPKTEPKTQADTHTHAHTNEKGGVKIKTHSRNSRKKQNTF